MATWLKKIIKLTINSVQISFIQVISVCLFVCGVESNVNSEKKIKPHPFAKFIYTFRVLQFTTCVQIH